MRFWLAKPPLQGLKRFYTTSTKSQVQATRRFKPLTPQKLRTDSTLMKLCIRHLGLLQMGITSLQTSVSKSSFTCALADKSKKHSTLAFTKEILTFCSLSLAPRNQSKGAYKDLTN